MVVVHRMAEFVDNDEIAQVLGKRHQEEAQRDVVLCGAAPPLGAGSPDGQFVVFQPRQPGQALDTSRQIGTRGTAQLLDTGFRLGRRQLRRQRGTPLRQTFARGLYPSDFLFEELHGPPGGNAAGKRQPHIARTAHADRDPACAARLGKGYLTQPGMFDGGKHRINGT